MYDTLATDTEPLTDIRAAQAPLKARYLAEPSAAIVIDHARTRSQMVPATNPLYGEVDFCDQASTKPTFALHEGVGGRSDLPVPGDMLCAALASCLDSTLRVIASLVSLTLTRLEVAVEAEVDLRGTLKLDENVPVAFQTIRVGVLIEAAESVSGPQFDMLLAAAEQSCVVLQTLRGGPARITIERLAS